MIDWEHYSWEKMGELIGLKSAIGTVVYQFDADRASVHGNIASAPDTWTDGRLHPELTQSLAGFRAECQKCRTSTMFASSFTR